MVNYFFIVFFVDGYFFVFCFYYVFVKSCNGGLKIFIGIFISICFGFFKFLLEVINI